MIAPMLARSPGKQIPMALALVCTGLLLVVFGAVWTRLCWTVGLGPGASDFLRGFVVGLALVLEVAGVALAATAARAHKP